MSDHQQIGPVGGDERIATLDVLRGFALFGILLVNIGAMANPVLLVTSGRLPAETLPDLVADAAVAFLATGKFYSLFSFLFGLGFALQVERASVRGETPTARLVRRQLVLLVLGLLHRTLVWSGDILALYGLVGLVLLLFRGRQPKTLLLWAGSLVLGLLVIVAVGVGLAEIAQLIPEGRAEITRGIAQEREQFSAVVASAYLAYGSGTWVDQVRQRLDEVRLIAPGELVMGVTVLSQFLVGMYVARRRWLHDVEAHRRRLRTIALLLLGPGIALNAFGAFLHFTVDPFDFGFGVLGQVLALLLGAPTLCFVYAAAIALACGERPKAWLLPVARAGQMALSNYLGQSLLCTTLFYSFGFGLFGRVGVAAGLGLALVVWFAQVVFSTWWLSRFRFGPFEWLWRSLTYRQVQPMRLDAEAR